MRKLQAVLCLAVFSTMVSGCVSAASADDAQAGTQAAEVTAANSQATETPAPAAAPEAVASAEQAPQQAAQTPADPADPYKVTSFFADFTRFTIGDAVPALYRTKQYEVTQWSVRHLPAPVEGSHWTYMGGNYAMISDDEGKILKAEAGEIYYNH